MYCPPLFKIEDSEAIYALMRAHPLTTLVQTTGAGLVANHLPLQLVVQADGQVVLQGHVARANPLWQDALTDANVLAIFTGVDTHVSASWYPSKVVNHRVVPTWNFTAVHAHGRVVVHDDAAWVRAQMDALVATHEVSTSAQEIADQVRNDTVVGMATIPAWRVDDAPDDYVAANLRAVVGIEIVVTRMEAKFKVSQNQTDENRAGVVAGLQSLGTERGAAMAQCMQVFAPKDV